MSPLVAYQRVGSCCVVVVVVVAVAGENALAGKRGVIGPIMFKIAEQMSR